MKSLQKTCTHMSLTCVRVDDDVAGQEDAELGLGLQRGVGELRVARPENQVWVAIDVELLLEGCLHVDLAQHAEPLAGELRADPGHRFGEAQLRGAAQRVAGVNVGHASSSSLLFALSALARCSAALGGSLLWGSRYSRIARSPSMIAAPATSTGIDLTPVAVSSSVRCSRATGTGRARKFRPSSVNRRRTRCDAGHRSVCHSSRQVVVVIWCLLGS